LKISLDKREHKAHECGVPPSGYQGIRRIRHFTAVPLTAGCRRLVVSVPAYGQNQEPHIPNGEPKMAKQRKQPAQRMIVPKAQRDIPRSLRETEPLVARSSSKDASRISKSLNERLDLLCAEFGIKRTSRRKYRELSLVLLADVIGVPAFQVSGEPFKGGGGRPVFWTLRRHARLVNFVGGLVREGRSFQFAIGRARAKFSEERGKEIADRTVAAEYHRAVKFFKSAPSTASMMIAALADDGNDPGARFYEFIKDGARVFTNSGVHDIPSHIKKKKAGR
jgi:hypothetical protein